MADGRENSHSQAQGSAETHIAAERRDENQGEGAKTPPEPEYGTVKVAVSNDRMTAKVEINVDKGQIHPTVDMLKAALEEARVVFGIRDKALEDASKYGMSTDVAFGKTAENGKDAEIIRNFNLGEKGRPKLIEYDRVDYKDMNLFVLTKKGQLLAERKLQTEGAPGTDVLGGVIRPKPGKPIQFKAGKNTYIENENFLYADIDGQILDNGKIISVDPHLQINDDVSVGTGNIDFTGAVSVKGSLDYGFKIKATGDVEISGVVNAGDIEAENISIKGGTLGGNRGRIIARGEIHATYVENATLVSGSNIFISDVALNSKMQAAKKISVQGKRGRIVGGRLQAGNAVEATQIGNKSNVVTEVAVGVNPMLQERYAAAMDAYKSARKKLAQIKKAREAFANVDLSTLSQERQKMVREMAVAKLKLLEEMEQNDSLVEELEAEMKELEHGFVRVGDAVFPGVKVKIGNVIKTVQTSEKHCVLKLEGEFIRTGPY